MDSIKNIVLNIYFIIRFKRFFLRLKGVKVFGGLRGKAVVHISKGRNIELHRNVYIGREVTLKSIGGLISIGENSLINDFTYINSADKITVGDNVLIAPFCHLTDRNHGTEKDKLIRVQKGNSAPIEIGNDVWLGSGVKVLKGVKIGDGAVVGANSVVTMDIPPYTIYAGIPARKIKDRE